MTTTKTILIAAGGAAATFGLIYLGMTGHLGGERLGPFQLSLIGLLLPAVILGEGCDSFTIFLIVGFLEFFFLYYWIILRICNARNRVKPAAALNERPALPAKPLGLIGGPLGSVALPPALTGDLNYLTAMKTFQRIVGTFAAIVFLAAGIKLTMVIGFGLGVVFFDLVALLAAAICGWIAWRGDLNENRLMVRFSKIVAFSFVFIVVSAVLFLLFTENYASWIWHDTAD